MSRFFQVKYDSRPKVVGVKDAGSQAMLVESGFSNRSGYDEYVEHFVSHKEGSFENQTRFPDRDFNLECAKLRKKAILTDFLRFGPAIRHKFLINKKVRSILQRFNLPPTKYYDANLFGMEALIVDYKFLFSPSISYDYVNFQESLFSTGDRRQGKKYFQVSSGSELGDILDPINRERIVLKNFSDKYDFFNLLISPYSYVSLSLRDELLAKSVTGIVFEEVDETALVFG